MLCWAPVSLDNPLWRIAMRASLLLLGLLLLPPAGISAQVPEPRRARPDRGAIDDRQSPRAEDGPSFRYRYGVDQDDRDLLAFRRWTPRIRCDSRDWRAAEQCERKVREIERREAEWRRDARRREEKFERDMARREREFRQKELERWRKHQRDLAERYRELRWYE